MLTRTLSILMITALSAGCTVAPVWSNPGEKLLDLLPGGREVHDLLTRDDVAVAEYPVTSPWVKAGVEKIRRRHYQQAIPILDKAIQQNPNDPSAYFYRAYAKQELFRRKADVAGAEIERRCQDWSHGGGIQTCITNQQVFQQQVSAARASVQSDLQMARQLRQRQLGAQPPPSQPKDPAPAEAKE